MCIVLGGISVTNAKRDICPKKYTVSLSNFDRSDPKMGVFLQSTEATLYGHLLKEKITPEDPPVDTMLMAAVAMVVQ